MTKDLLLNMYLHTLKYVNYVFTFPSPHISGHVPCPPPRAHSASLPSPSVPNHAPSALNNATLLTQLRYRVRGFAAALAGLGRSRAVLPATQ